MPILPHAQSLQITTLTEEDGLSSNAQWSTSAICKDSFGFVWFATLGGLDRYDGYELKSYRGIQNNNRDISNNRITAIAECGKGDLLLGTEEEGIIYFNREKEVFTAQQDIVVAGDTLTLRQINAIRKRGNDELIIASAFQGIFLYHIASGEFSEIVVDNPSFSVKSTNNLIVLKDQRLAIVSYNGVFVESNSGSFDFFEIDRINYLKYIIELPDGNILVRATNRSEEYVLNLKTSEVLQIKSSNKTPNCSGIVDKNGDLWLSNASGELFKKNGGILGSYLAQVERKGTYFPICMQHMLVSDNGNIYYTSNTGVGSFQESQFPIQPYSDDEIKVFHHFDGTLYFAGKNTIYKMEDGQKQFVLKLPSAYSNNEIYNFHKDLYGNYWVGHKGQIGKGTVYDSQGKQISKTYLSALSPQYIEFKEDSLLTIGNQVYRDDEKSQPYKYIGDLYTSYTGKRYPDYRVKYYTQLSNGEVWICTFSDGIYLLNRSTKTVQKLPVDPNGNGKLKSDNPYYLYEHSSGVVFVATERGVHLWDPKTQSFAYLNERVENIGKRVKGMGEDSKGNVWMLNADNLRSYDVGTQEIKEFPLGETVFVEYEEPRDMVFTENGDFLFQGYDRIYTFDPAKLTSESEPNKVLFTDLYISRKKLYPRSEGESYQNSVLFENNFSFPYKYGNIGFSFVSIDGKDKNVSYFYRLLGESEEWIETKEKREVYYSNLNPGNYVFEVKAQAGNGLWTKASSKIYFKISPPWYLSWYAYLAYALATLLVIYAIYRLRINQLLRYQDLRIKVSSDLHDDVGSLLTGISMKAQILGLGKKGEEKESLGELSNLSYKAMDQMRDIVWALDARKDSIEDLKQRMLTFAQENLSIKDINYDIDFKSYAGFKAINPEQRQNLYSIFKEAITNILKHSDADFVKVSLQKTPLGSKLIIHDNGSVDKDLSVSGQGLSNIKMRAERLGGVAEFDFKDGFKVEVSF